MTSTQSSILEAFAFVVIVVFCLMSGLIQVITSLIYKNARKPTWKFNKQKTQFWEKNHFGLHITLSIFNVVQNYLSILMNSNFGQT